MESINNTIALKTACTSAMPLKWEKIQEESGGEELEGLILSTQRVLDHMETLWEINHNAVELRDKFHLLRCYLDYINQYCEGYRP
ncbi:MAG: hypothetical protein NT010_09690 [Proteobacteria bacterium]|nr:hypothetical protein [Pseudomonadota bacterium]